MRTALDVEWQGEVVQVYSAVILIRRGDRVLAVTRSSRADLGFPGGKCEGYDLSPLATALRELREETGLHMVGSRKPLYVGDAGHGRLCAAYMFQIRDATHVLRFYESYRPEGGIEVRWVAPEALITPACEYAAYNKAALEAAGILGS